MHTKTFLNRLFTTLSGFTILLLISISLGAIYSIFTLRQINVDARGFVNTTMLDLFVDWDNKKFLVHTSHELQQQMTDEQLQKMNVIFTRLGELLNYHGAHGGLYRSSTSWWYFVARYKVLASFQGGQFIAIITLIKQQGNWTIGQFKYNYAYFPIQRHSGSLKRV